MVRDELVRCWRHSESAAYKLGKCAHFLLDGPVMLFLQCAGALHWNQGSSDLWHVSINLRKWYWLAPDTDYETIVSDTLRMQQDYTQRADTTWIGLCYSEPHSAEFQPECSGCKSPYYLFPLRLEVHSLTQVHRAEAALCIAYPEPWNKGKALGYWLTYRLSGQILGGAVNIGLNA